jgi:hypothetical protein
VTYGIVVLLDPLELGRRRGVLAAHKCSADRSLVAALTDKGTSCVYEA